MFYGHVRSERHQEPVIDLGHRRDWAMRLHVLNPSDRKDEDLAEGAARRVDSAIRRLETDRLLERVQEKAMWRILRGDRSGRPYRSETDEELRLRIENRDLRLRRADYGQRSLRYDAIGYGSSGPYVQAEFWEEPPLEVPVSLWANGWVSELSAAALMVFLIVLDRPGPRRGNAAPFRVPRIRRSQYAATKAVWLKGRDELQSRGVITRKVGDRSGAVNRELYFLNLETIESKNLCPPKIDLWHGSP
jgi:hypothetical protein